MGTELSEFERAALDKLLDGDDAVLSALREQLRTCCVRKREMTGCGFFTELDVDRALAGAPTNVEKLRVGDVEACVAGLEHGAGFVLFVRDGYLDMLEGYSFDEPWPDAITDFTLAYSGGSRDVKALQLGSL
jgi:hypothetical protein